MSHEAPGCAYCMSCADPKCPAKELAAARAELEAARKDAERRLRLLRLHHSDAMELWKALTDLSFECDNVIATYDGKVGAPTIETYNRTFDVIAKHRAAYSEEARNACMQGNTITAAMRQEKP